MLKYTTEKGQLIVEFSRLLYTAMVIFNTIGFFSALVTARRRGEHVKDVLVALGSSVVTFVLLIPRGLALTLLAILWFTPECIFRGLPLSFKSKVRYGRRYLLKAGLGVEQTAKLESKELKDMYRQHQKEELPRYQGGAGEACPLSNLLSVYDMLMAVTEEMHYLDVMTLSRVSKSVREAVLPAHDFDRRIETFRRYTCPGKKKQNCWTCDRQVCTVSLIAPNHNITSKSAS
jgi:hypothetical protein